MTPEQWLAFVILPIACAALGWVAVFLHEWSLRRSRRREQQQEGARPLPH